MSSIGPDLISSPPAARTGKASAKVRFLLAMSGVCTPIVVIGWLSDLRGVLHGMLLALSLAAFLPLLVVLACIAMILVLSLVSAVAGESVAPTAADSVGLAEGLVAFLKRFFVPYYRFLFARRSPVFLGAVSGVLLGTTLLWTILALIVLPGEVCTLKRLTAMQDAIEHFYKLHGRYPSPVQDKWLDRSVLSGEEPNWPACKAPSLETDGSDAVLLDGFGRRIRYQVAGHWRFASYGLTSLGYDGQEGKDDICLTGATRAGAALGKVADAADSLHRLYRGLSGRPSRHDWWAALRSANCPSDSRRGP